MNATDDTQNGSNGNELNVLVAALGLTGNSRYVPNVEALADRAEKAIKSIAGINGRRVDTVVVRENYELCQVLQDRMEGEALPDVQYYGIDWRRLLDDTDETDSEGNVLAKGVMQEDEKPVGQLMAEAHEDVDADGFNLHDREDREEIDYDLLSQDRINRAKARARGKTDERLYNDYFDSVPTVSEAIFLNDGTNRGIAAVEAARGINPFVKYPSECSGSVLEVSCNKDGDQIIDWARYLLETGKVEADELTEAQETHLRETYSVEDLEYMGLSVEADEEAKEPAVEPDAMPDRDEVTAAEAEAVVGQPVSGD
ncbi:hypothetical protein [Haloarcula sp. K1]|uniref:hypothetical protein n=1 Tax=Haloarcula sp. K1 TaxID=1622207 RepID=UPI0007BB1A77|nr:hypothetical protein [Haloarcula sp. K1]KZX46223.1 hypothetical protein AV929_15735 [Haloarcula sp. K1]